MLEDRQYTRRLKLAIAISLVAHGALFAAGTTWQPEAAGEGPVPDFVVLDIEPELNSPARQLVETVTPSDTLPEDAQYIARANTQAADTMLREGAQPGPINEVESPEERLGTPGVPPLAVPPVPATPAAAAEEEAAEQDEAAAEESPEEPAAPDKAREEAEPTPEPERTPKREQVASVQQTMRDRDAPVVATPQRTNTRIEQPKAEAPRNETAEPGAMAQAQPAAVRPPAPSSPPRGKMNNGVMTKGFTSYSAIEDEIAPYLEEVKKRVELRWREALLLQYTGSQPRDVEVDCEIARDGRLVSVKLAAPAEDRIYGQLCLDAIRKAAPFAAFPFEVPDIYRNQNLEIRWHFSFL